MSNQNGNSSEYGGRPGHRRLADRILDAMDQAEGQGRTDIANQLRRVHQLLAEQEASQYAHRRVVD